MNKIIVSLSFIITAALIHSGISTKVRVDALKNENAQLQADNLDMKREIVNKESLFKQTPVSLSTAYSVVLNHIRLLESYSGTNMGMQLDGAKDAEDIAAYYVNTEYKGIKGLKIRIIVNKFSKETDMGAVLDDIHLLEKSTDFTALELSKDNNNLIVKGEIYGL